MTWKRLLNTRLILLFSLHPQRSIDLQLPDGGPPSRRGSYGSDTESRLPSGNKKFYLNTIIYRFRRNFEVSNRKF